MELLVETNLSDLMIFLIKDYKIADKIIEKDLIYKSDNLSKYVKSIINRNNLNIKKDISKFYITSGPGSFMGVRASLIYFITLAKILDKPLYTLESLKFIQKNDENVFWDAKGGQSYKLEKDIISISEFNKNSLFDLNFFENNIEKIISKFKLQDPLKVIPDYIKEPKIG